MSLADDLIPEACLEACTETIEENLVAVSKNLPDPNDSPKEAARKYVILGKCLRSIKEYTKEALKSVQMGSDSTAFSLMEGRKHRSLENFADTQVTISVPDGDKTETTVEKFNEACEAVQKDPSIVDRVLAGGE